MQKHTGYLWIQNSTQQSGLADWYLASDVDTRIAKIEQLFEARVKQLEEKLADEKKMGAALSTSNQRLRQKIDRLSR